jgi:hypothetical protein
LHRWIFDVSLEFVASLEFRCIAGVSSYRWIFVVSLDIRRIAGIP